MSTGIATLTKALGGKRQGLVDVAMIEGIFDHVPELAFFIKDPAGRYQVVNQSLAERCGLKGKHDLLGRTVWEIFPKELAEVYARQDARVLRTGKPLIDHLEMHWYALRKPGWCLTTKLPIRDASGAVAGIIGISRDLRVPGDSEAIPAGLAKALEFLETNHADQVSPGSLAQRAGLPPARFARLIKRIFRVTPNQLILQTRVNAAARLLLESETPVAEIACACGFYDHSALTRAFRSVTRLTPTQFRRLQSSRPPQPARRRT